MADGWGQWSQHFERETQKQSELLAKLARIKSGQRILDIATGIGEPAITAAKIVGNNGYVMATDISIQMLRIAKDRASFLGLQNIDFKESDAETLDLSYSSFDAVLCRWGLMLLSNVDAALSKIYYSLVSGGRFAAAVWADASRVPIISVAMQVINEQLPRPQSEAPSPFSLANVRKLEDHLVNAGFGDVHTETLDVTFRFTSGEDYSHYRQAVSIPAHKALAKVNEETKEHIWSQVAAAALQNYGDGRGQIKMVNQSICVSGTKQ